MNLIIIIMRILKIFETFHLHFLRCEQCKHYGASVPCKASDKFFHWPCAVASGAFMEKSSLLMVSVENYEKVAALATNAVYLYYTGDQWKIGKV